MKLPETICLGYQDIEIIEADMLEGQQGAYISDKSQIRIQEGMDSREQINTLFHEMIHAIFYVYGAKPLFKDDEEEETIVNVIGNGLAEVLARNPAVAKWLAHHAGK